MALQVQPGPDMAHNHPHPLTSEIIIIIIIIIGIRTRISRKINHKKNKKKQATFYKVFPHGGTTWDHSGGGGGMLGEGTCL